MRDVRIGRLVLSERYGVCRTLFISRPLGERTATSALNPANV